MTDHWKSLLAHPSMPYRNEYLSVSRLKVYEQCPKRFFFSYVMDAPRTSSVPADFGKLVHAVFEDLFNWVVEEEFSGIIPEEKMIECYRERWATQSLFTDAGTSELTGETLYAEGLGMCRDYLNSHPDVSHWNILGVEVNFDLEIEGRRVFGFIDRVDKIDDTTVEIIDYKTNRMLFSRDDLEHDIQVSIYALAAEQLWPWAKNVRFKFEMLRHSTAQTATRSADDLATTRRYLVDTARASEQSPREWPGRLGPLCAWCSSRGECDTYTEALADGGNREIITPEILIEISRERETIAALVSPLNAQKKVLDKILAAELEDVDELTLGDHVYKMLHIKAREYPDLSELTEVVSRFGDMTEAEVRDRLLTVSRKQLDGLVREIRERLDAEPDGSARKALFSMEMLGVEEMKPSFSRISSRLSRNAKPSPGQKQIEGRRAKALPEKVWRDDLPCGFCGEKPGKLVERGGQRFGVCKAHERKRKPPAKIEA